MGAAMGQHVHRSRRFLQCVARGKHAIHCGFLHEQADHGRFNVQQEHPGLLLGGQRECPIRPVRDPFETSGATLVSAPNDVILIKFPTPVNLNDYAYVGSFLQTLGGNVTDTAAVILSTSMPPRRTGTTQPTCRRLLRAARLAPLAGSMRTTCSRCATTTSARMSRHRSKAGAKEIALCIRYTTTKTFQFSSRQGSWTPGLYLK